MGITVPEDIAQTAVEASAAGAHQSHKITD